MDTCTTNETANRKIVASHEPATSNGESCGEKKTLALFCDDENLHLDNDAA